MMKRLLVAVAAVGTMLLPHALPVSAEEPAAQEVDEPVATDAPPPPAEPESDRGDEDESVQDTTDIEDIEVVDDQTTVADPPVPEALVVTEAPEPETQQQQTLPQQHQGEDRPKPTEPPRDDRKVWICHATAGLGELKNGYNLIEVSVNSAQYRGHEGHVDEARSNSMFGDLYDILDIDPDNLPGACGSKPPPPPPPPPPPKWTPPVYPPFEPEPCVEYRLEKSVSTWSAQSGAWSSWEDWSGAGPLSWGYVPSELVGHHGGRHGKDDDRHFAYVVVNERAITTGECAPPPVYPPEVIVIDGECEPGDNEVAFSTQTTTFVAVWNPQTMVWERSVDEVSTVAGVRPLTVEEQQECAPPDLVEVGEWVDGQFECDDTTVEQTRVVTTTPYVYVDNMFVEDTENATSVTETQTRVLTEDEITECPPPSPELEFTVLGPECIDNFPYIGWTVAGDGFDPTLPLTITLSQAGTVIQTITDAPFSGTVIWPGASVTPPDWPGWRLNDAGVWVPDPSDAGLRDDITVTASVNPTAIATVSYPPATSECVDPPTDVPPTDRPPTDVPPTDAPPMAVPPKVPTSGSTPSLPATGTEVSLIVAIASLFLLLGGGAVVVTRRRPGRAG